MICQIEGILVEKSPTQAVIETNGLAYLVTVPLSTSDKLGAAGSRTRLFTHLCLREENLELYGFATSEEKRMFEMLIQVPGIGPKVAIRVLSGLSPGQLQEAVLAQDLALVTRVPGIGKKIGERLVTELKEQMKKLPFAGEEIRAREAEVFSDAVEALVILGYKRNQAVSAVNGILKEMKGKPAFLESVIKEALKKI